MGGEVSDIPTREGLTSSSEWPVEIFSHTGVEVGSHHDGFYDYPTHGKEQDRRGMDHCELFDQVYSLHHHKEDRWGWRYHPEIYI